MVPDALSTAVASFIGVHNNSKQEKGKKKRRKEWPNLLIGALVVERAGSLVAETASLVKRLLAPGNKSLPRRQPSQAQTLPTLQACPAWRQVVCSPTQTPKGSAFLTHQAALPPTTMPLAI